MVRILSFSSLFPGLPLDFLSVLVDVLGFVLEISPKIGRRMDYSATRMYLMIHWKRSKSSLNSMMCTVFAKEEHPPKFKNFLFKQALQAYHQVVNSSVAPPFLTPAKGLTNISKN